METYRDLETFIPPDLPDTGWRAPANGAGQAKPRAPVSATPFVWPAKIEPRQWVYAWHYIRKFVSATVAPGGVGKSGLTLVEALAIVTGRPLLGIQPDERTRVWLWNGEDPHEELQRRVVAAAMHYGIEPKELEGRLFVDSGRVTPITIAMQAKDGTKINAPDVAAVTATIKANGIGVLVIDPFVTSHSVSENDNGAINLVAKTWAQIADETGCAIELVHHSRKTNGNEVTVEDGRGAVALLGAARAARALNSMTQQEAEDFGVENRRVMFRYFDGKANLAPASEDSTWFQIQSFDLGNGTADRPPDSVGVVTRWEPPQAMDRITIDHMNTVRRRVGEASYRANVQARDWVGHLVAEVAGLNASDPADKRTIKAAIGAWIKSGVLAEKMVPDEKRNMRPTIVAGALNA